MKSFWSVALTLSSQSVLSFNGAHRAHHHHHYHRDVPHSPTYRQITAAAAAAATTKSALFGKKQFNTGKPLRSISAAVRKRSQAHFVVLVDANNVRGMDENFRLTNYDLLRALSVWQTSTKNNQKQQTDGVENMAIICVMDHGAVSCTSTYQGIEVVFAGPERTADDVLAEDCQWWLSRNYDVLVATSDRELVARCLHSPNESSESESNIQSKVEVFGSSDMSGVLRKVWNQNVIMRRSTLPANGFSLLDQLQELEDDIRSRFDHSQRSLPVEDERQNVDDGTGNKKVSTLGQTEFRETTWQRVLLAEQLRMVLIQKEQQQDSSETDEESHLPELLEYRSKYSNVTGQLNNSIFNDQRIRHDETAQEGLRHYMEETAADGKRRNLLLTATIMDECLE